jgi:hypothetical protein
LGLAKVLNFITNSRKRKAKRHEINFYKIF